MSLHKLDSGVGRTCDYIFKVTMAIAIALHPSVSPVWVSLGFWSHLIR
ncbi:hypothetical protein H6F88_22605 [Oculatella sp. FACHB-28]|nr:hypothetical protein [Oculatella sp. FACHB-28]